MPGPRPVVVTLAREVRQKLEAVCRGTTHAQREVLRARIVLLAADGHTNAAIGARLAVTVSTVRKWSGRFWRQGWRDCGTASAVADLVVSTPSHGSSSSACHAVRFRRICAAANGPVMSGARPWLRRGSWGGLAPAPRAGVSPRWTLARHAFPRWALAPAPRARPQG